MQNITLVAAVIAVTEAIKRQFPQVSGIITILVAAVIGLIAGFVNFQGLDPISGAVLGLSAVGVHIVTSNIVSK